MDIGLVILSYLFMGLGYAIATKERTESAFVAAIQEFYSMFPLAEQAKTIPLVWVCGHLLTIATFPWLLGRDIYSWITKQKPST